MGVITKKVTVGGRSKILAIPESGDRSYDNYLVEAETEKAENELRKAPVKKFVKPTDANAIGAIKEQRAWIRHKQQTGSRMFGGITLGSK